MQSLQQTIENAFLTRVQLSPKTVEPELKRIILDVIDQLGMGKLRVAERTASGWQVNEWVKKAVLLYFACIDNQVINGHHTQFYDKIPLKYHTYDASAFYHERVRVVPPAYVRSGAYIGPGCVLMPSYINIGAYIDSGVMVDTWATVGSCAQIGKNVHLSGGVGIGGVLEPLQSTPTIIEDNVFIGARSEIVEGVIVEENAVISMGVYLGQSTRIYDRDNDTIRYGRVPAGSVVVPGNLPAADGSHSLYCAVIVKQVDAKTRAKTNINQLLREWT